MAYSIYAYVLPILGFGGHLYLDIYDDSGSRVAQLNGLGVDRETGVPVAFGDIGDQLMSSLYPDQTFTDGNFIIEGSGTSLSTNTHDGELVFSGSQTEIEAVMNALRAYSDFINNQNIVYNPTPTTLHGDVNYNSNSVFAGAVKLLTNLGFNIDLEAVKEVSDLAFTPGYDKDILQGDTWYPIYDENQNISGFYYQNISSLNDVISGVASKKIFGSSGDDTLIGRNSVDKFVARDGDNYLDGQEGNDYAFYDNESISPTSPDTSITLNITPTRATVDVILGDFEHAGFEVINRFEGRDTLISIENVVAEAGVDNKIVLEGNQAIQQKGNGSYDWNGLNIRLENFSSYEGDKDKQLFAFSQFEGVVINGGDGFDTVDYSSVNNFGLEADYVGYGWVTDYATITERGGTIENKLYSIESVTLTTADDVLKLDAPTPGIQREFNGGGGNDRVYYSTEDISATITKAWFMMKPAPARIR